MSSSNNTSVAVCDYCGWRAFKWETKGWKHLDNGRVYCPYCAAILWPAPAKVWHFYPKNEKEENNNEA